LEIIRKSYCELGEVFYTFAENRSSRNYFMMPVEVTSRSSDVEITTGSNAVQTSSVSNNSSQPVWDVYDDYRTAVWNVEIQQEELKKLKSINNWIEIPLAILASSSVTSIYFWTTPNGKMIWTALSFMTAVLAVVKPFLKLPEKIEQRGQMLADFCLIETALEKIKKRISAHKKYDDELQEQYLKVLDLKSEIRKKCMGANSLSASQKIKDECFERVQKRHPKDSFYIP
jgi:hypothetical protein